VPLRDSGYRCNNLSSDGGQDLLSAASASMLSRSWVNVAGKSHRDCRLDTELAGAKRFPFGILRSRRGSVGMVVGAHSCPATGIASIDFPASLSGESKLVKFASTLRNPCNTPLRYSSISTSRDSLPMVIARSITLVLMYWPSFDHRSLCPGIS
jgi:hypothetical protein